MAFDESILQLEIAINSYWPISTAAVGAPIEEGQSKKATLKAILQKASHPKENVELIAKNFGHLLKGVARQANALRLALTAQGIIISKGNSPENRTLSGPFNKPTELVRYAQIDTLPDWYSSTSTSNTSDGAMALVETDETSSSGGEISSQRKWTFAYTTSTFALSTR